MGSKLQEFFEMKNSKVGEKRKTSETNSEFPKKFCFDSITFFKNQEIQKFSIEKKELQAIYEENEKLNINIASKDATFEKLQKDLQAKCKAYDELQKKYNSLCKENSDLNGKFINLNMTYCSLEESYEKDRISLNKRLKEYENQFDKLQTELEAKEAECAAYLIDIRGQLANAGKRNGELEEEVTVLKAKIVNFERLVESKKKQTIADKNLLKQVEVKMNKLQTKLKKKKEQLNLVETELKNADAQNKKLKVSLASQQNKIHQLQCVLDRPIVHSSPLRESDEGANVRLNQVQPLEGATEPSGPSLRQIQTVQQYDSTEVQPVPQNVQSNNINNQPQPIVIEAAAPIRVEKKPQQNISFKGNNVSQVNSPDEASEDMLFPSYFPKKMKN